MARHPAVLIAELGSTLAELRSCELDGVDATLLADVLVDLMGVGSQLDAVTALVAGRVEASKVWANDGSRSAAAWLGRAASRDRSETAAVFARARALREMPETEGEHAEGRLSARHVRLLATARHIAPEAFAADEAWLVEQARTLCFEDFVTVVQVWRQCAAPDAIEDEARRRYERRAVHLSKGLEGSGHLDAEFEPVGHAIFGEALRRIEQELWKADWADARERLGDDAKKRDLTRSDAQRRYDALIEMARRSAAMPPKSRKPLPLITVHVDHQTLAGRICQLSTGTVVTPGEVLPLLGDAEIERAVFAGGSRIVDLGRRSRFFVGGTRRAVEILNPTCIHGTCDVPAERCDVDHVVDWDDGGRTDQDNGAPRCPAHHPKRRQKNKAGRRSRRGTGKGTSREDADDEGHANHDLGAASSRRPDDATR